VYNYDKLLLVVVKNSCIYYYNHKVISMSALCLMFQTGASSTC